MIRALSIFGTRPEAIKMSPAVLELQSRPDRFESLVCLTGQHREMLDAAMADFGLEADRDLDLMRPGQTPAEVAASILRELPAVFQALQPDVVLVQGDTTTTFVAAFAAFLERIPVGHIEAGLRTGNLAQPFPEEANRVLTSRLATLHFPPTERAAVALLAEGHTKDRVIQTGNTVIDALLRTIRTHEGFSQKVLADRDPDRSVVLVTAHRRESFGAPLIEICRAISTLATDLPDYDFILPVHPNPEVRRTVETHLPDAPNLLKTDPIPYREFAQLLASAHLVLTDSGGIQEEAPALDIPVLVMRETTERPEGVDAGTAILVGSDANRIVTEVRRLVDDTQAYERMARATNPYGDGKAAVRIVDALEAWFGRK